MIGFIAARIYHARLAPKKNAFRYGAPYLLIPLEDFVAHRIGILSIERMNLFSLRRADYGVSGCPKTWIVDVLQKWNVPQADGQIFLMTMPRMFGYGFNPVNFWFCKDRQGALRAVLAEVNNTFGERHCYLCIHEDRRSILPQDLLQSEKVFHVSPFIETSGTYSFRFALDAEDVAVVVNLTKDGEPLLRTSISGRVQPLTSGRLLKALAANPLLPLKVIFLIHYQAAKLFLKRVRHVAKPDAPAKFITR